MTIIIPQAASTFGDSTRTKGDALSRKYVLAQFRSDANLEWVGELRSTLVTDELKFPVLLQSEARLRQNRQLWSRVENGLGQATIIVIDPDEARNAVAARAFRDGADLYDLEQDLGGFVDKCATALVGWTPIAYLPHNLARVIPWRSLEYVDSLEAFTPQQIRAALGGGLRNAQVFAARAHAVFDLATDDDRADSTEDVFRSPLADVMLSEILATPRTFDEELPSTLPLLNQAADEIAKAIATTLSSSITYSTESLIVEANSRDSDEMQAADLAAGWARELLERGDAQSLGARFRRVWVNGRRIR